MYLHNCTNLIEFQGHGSNVKVTSIGCILRWFTCPQTVTHSSSDHLIATRLENNTVGHYCGQ